MKSQVFMLCLVLLYFCPPAWAQNYLEDRGLCFCRIPGGSYVIGSPLSEAGRYANEALPHRVTLKPFYLAQTLTTNAQYDRFLKVTGHTAPLYWQDRNLNAPNQPVVGVCWHDAQAFCRWLSDESGVRHRLPTEAEWEAAARGGLAGEPFPWGRDFPDAVGCRRANYDPRGFANDGVALTVPVASFPPNGYGLYDMAGNVSEWCADPCSPPEGRDPFPAPDCRVRKGGSWRSQARDLRCAARKFSPPGTADGFIGFRVLREIP